MVSPTELAGLTLGEAFRQWVLNDHEVIERGRAVPRNANVFDEGQYPVPIGISFLWPLHLETAQLASDFVDKGSLNGGRPQPQPTAAHWQAAETIATRWSALCGLLKDAALIGIGCYVATGREETIPPAQWSRSSMLVDVRNSDLVEGPCDLPSVRWTGIVLAVRDLKISEAPDTPPTTAKKRIVTTINARNACEAWLVGHMRTSPRKKIDTKSEWWRKAKDKWAGSLSRDAFDRAWAGAAEFTGAIAWTAAGAPKKSPVRNQSIK